MFPAVFPVAGLGTRSLPASKVIPKEMLPLYDRPIIQHIVEEAVASGVKDVIFVNSRGKSSIEDHFDIQPELETLLQEKGKDQLLRKVYQLSRLVNVQSVRQKEALGLGHAVLMAKSMVSASHFFVLLGDEVTIAEPPACKQLLDRYEEIQSSSPGAGVVMVMKVPEDQVSRYGICELETNSGFKVKRCVEKPQASETDSRWAITGRYFLPREIFKMIEEQPKGALGEIQLTDALNQLAQQGNLFVCEQQGLRFDTGDRLGYLDSILHFYVKNEESSQVRALLKKYEERLS